EFEINSAGFRDREHSLENPQGVIRVAVLGDSYIEALQVPVEAMFASVLERELAERGAGTNQRFEVLSFGVSGFGTAQELLMLRHHVWQFKPDVVLLAFLAGNDIRNNSRELEPERLRPFFELINGELRPDFTFRSDPAFQNTLSRSFRLKTKLYNASRVLQVARAVYHGELSRRRASSKPAMADESVQAANSDEIGLDDQCFVTPTSEEWRAAWRLTERLIEQMNLECQQQNCQFAVTLVTSGIQVNPDDQLRQAYAKRLRVSDLGYADRRLVKFGERSGIPVIPLSSRLLKFARMQNVYLHGFSNTNPGEGHWNEHGHREAARICAAELLRIHDEEG
ncbi:MAG: SGNH/GDSL hydrolase family protein, partial [Planctomycetota bacterium]|nr:SGNH/GDSL hydrolase family protein [Planctomycetota bacterium]